MSQKGGKRLERIDGGFSCLMLTTKTHLWSEGQRDTGRFGEDYIWEIDIRLLTTHGVKKVNKSKRIDRYYSFHFVGFCA